MVNLWGIKFYGGFNMTQVSPFHSKKIGTKVHHNNNKCTEGNNIETYNIASGTGNLPLCDHCKRLNAEGK